MPETVITEAVNATISHSIGLMERTKNTKMCENRCLVVKTIEIVYHNASTSSSLLKKYLEPIEST